MSHCQWDCHGAFESQEVSWERIVPECRDLVALNCQLWIQPIFSTMYFMSVFSPSNLQGPKYPLKNCVYLCFCAFLLCLASACTSQTATIILSPKLSHGQRTIWHQTKLLTTGTWIMGIKISSRFFRHPENGFLLKTLFS